MRIGLTGGRFSRWHVSFQISSATRSGSRSSVVRVQVGDAGMTTVSPRSRRPGLLLFRASQQVPSFMSEKTSGSGRCFEAEP
jgi:hypothetical protein